MMQQCIIFDIDGTLADNSHRQYLLMSNKYAWKQFFDSMGEDLPNKPIFSLYQTLQESKKYKMIIATGRPDNYKKLTEQWLFWNNIIYDELYMRKAGDTREDSLVKEEILFEIQKKYFIVFVVDDRTSVVNMWRKHGITCLQCNDNML